MKHLFVLWVMFFSAVAVAATLVHSLVVTVPSGSGALSNSSVKAQVVPPHEL